jgi:tetratricopeptide (TPR) repeat protein
LIPELLNAGLRLHQAGQFEQANSYYKQVLSIAPQHPDALHLSGLIAFQSGHLEHAVALIEHAIRVQPRNAAFHANLAQVHMAAARPEEAHAAFRRAAKIDPGNPQFATGAASCLAMQGKPKEAERQLREIVRRHARYALAWFNLGNAVRDQGRHEEAIEHFRRVIDLDARFPDVWTNLGNVLHQLERFSEAERCFREHLTLHPESVAGHGNLAAVLIDCGRFAEGEAVSRQGLARAGDPAERPKLLRVLATALAHQGKMNAMRDAARSAAAAAPADARAQWAYGYALVQTGQYDEGRGHLERALSLEPGAEELRAASAGLHLSHGDLQSGWRAYGARRARTRAAAQFPALPIDREIPVDLSGRTVCLLPEQGLGDNLFFLRYARALKSRGARVVCLADVKLVALLARVAAIDEVIPDETAPAVADFHALVGTLPDALARFETSPVAHCSSQSASGPRYARHLRVFYPELPPPLSLNALPQRIDELRQQLARIGPAPYAGVTWRAGIPPVEQKGSAWVLHKEIPLSGLGGALRDSRCTLLSLQRRPLPGETEQLALQAGRPVHDFSGLNDDLETMLALLSVIDEYVGVSNTNMHLRAGVGATARVLVPQPPEWRWMAVGDESPWFPGFRIYRQDREGRWDSALARLAHDLGRQYPPAR